MSLSSGFVSKEKKHIMAHLAQQTGEYLPVPHEIQTDELFLIFKKTFF